MDKIKIEFFIIIFSVLVLFGLGVRMHIETDIQATTCRIVELEGQLIVKDKHIRSLQEQLAPPVYAQPVKQVIISSGTGIRQNPWGGSTEALHKGLDMIGKKGEPVYAVLAGRVAEHWLPPGWYGGKLYNGHPVMGGYIVLDHGDELFSIYGHLSTTVVHEGQWIGQGEKIGGMGNNGRSTGVHLHLEIVINPLKYLAERR